MLSQEPRATRIVAVRFSSDQQQTSLGAKYKGYYLLWWRKRFRLVGKRRFPGYKAGQCFREKAEDVETFRSVQKIIRAANNFLDAGVQRQRRSSPGHLGSGKG